MSEVAQLIGRVEDVFAGLHLSDGWYTTLVDRTGLTGRYDLSLSVPATRMDLRTREEIEQRSIAILRALDAQLGLKLERGRAPMATLIIDKAQKPHVD